MTDSDGYKPVNNFDPPWGQISSRSYSHQYESGETAGSWQVDRRTLLRSGFAAGAATLAGCPGGGAADSPDSRVTITDAVDRTVEVPTSIDRIVAIGPGALRQVAYLGAAERVVGVERGEHTSLTSLPYNAANLRFRELPVVGPSGPNATGNVEAILEVSPDIVLLSAVSGGEAAEQVENQAGVPTVVLPMPFPTGRRPHEVFYGPWRQLGDLLGTSERAETLIESVRGHAEAIRSRVPDGVDPAVYAGGVSFKGAQGLAATWVPYPPFVYTGASNVAAGIDADGVAVSVSRERLLSWDPSFVFISAQNAKLVREDLRKHPELRSIEAFRARRAHSILPVAHYHVNVGSMLVNSYFVGSRLYPDSFEDIDIESVADEVYADLLDEGVYENVVPPLGAYEQFGPVGG
jgi:iron complex transport system substrate-binding protein